MNNNLIESIKRDNINQNTAVQYHFSVLCITKTVTKSKNNKNKMKKVIFLAVQIGDIGGKILPVLSAA
ncbi:TPA: hypothetical protein ACU0L4_000257 [Streptococcus suis]